MQFPKSLHADGWHAHMPDQRPLPPIPVVTHDRGDDETAAPHHGRRVHVIGIAVVALAALAASARLDVGRDPRALDEQLSSAMLGVSGALAQWQQQLSRGLQVSLQAVADGSRPPRDMAAPAEPQDPLPTSGQSDPATVVARAEPVTSAEPIDLQQPVRADLAPRRVVQR
jgi:hypothetical protein